MINDGLYKPFTDKNHYKLTSDARVASITCPNSTRALKIVKHSFCTNEKKYVEFIGYKESLVA